MAVMASGPTALYSSRPTLATPMCSRTALAMRTATTRSSTSRAIASRSFTSAMHGSCQLGDGGDALGVAPTGDVVLHAPAGTRVGEGRGADLDRRGPCEQQLDGVGTATHAADADDGQVGQRRVDVVD